MWVSKGLRNQLNDLDIRVKVAMVALGLSAFGASLTRSYNSLYAYNLGASPANLGLLTSISAAASSLISVPMGWAMEQYSVKRVMLLNLALFIVHLSIMGLAPNWFVLIPAYLISSRVLRMGPLSDIIFVTAVEVEKRGTVISISRVVRSILGLFAPLIAAFLVTFFGGLNATGIRPLYYVELGITFLITLTVVKYLPPTLGRVGKREKSGFSFSSLISNYRDALRNERNLQTWVVLRLVKMFGQYLVTPFIVLWLVESKGASPYILGVTGTLSMVVTLLLQIPVGRLADRYGRKKIYLLTNSFMFLGSILGILSPEPKYLIPLSILGGYAAGTIAGVGVAGVGMPLFVTWWWESVPEEKRGRFFGIEGLMGLTGIPASILGGVLWKRGYQVQVLLIPIILELVIVYPLLYKVRDITQTKK
jgi:MFS family permease